MSHRDAWPRPMELSWADSRAAFADAAQWFAGTTEQVDDRWEDPGLGEWDVRALVGHTSRALLTVESYLARPATQIEVHSPADYVRRASTIARGPEVAQRGRDAGDALGAEPDAAVREIVARVLRLLDDGTDGSEPVTTIIGGIRLRDYLPTRTFELVVHTADLATALGEPLDVPATAAAQALSLVADLALAGGRVGPLLLAATGRPALPPGFSVL